MILEYTITDKMISSVVSISEKIGRIKEIRDTHKHIDFDTMCNVENIQNALQDIGISYPDHMIMEFMEIRLSAKNTHKEDHSEVVKMEVEKFRKLKSSKMKGRNYFHPSRFAELSLNTKVVKKQAEIPKNVIQKLASPDKFFLYRVAEFCDACNGVTNETDLIQLWLTTLFLEEYNMLLYFPYKNVLKYESSVIKKGKRLIESLKYEANEHNGRYLLIEFYLLVIDSVLDESIRIHHKLANPTSDRVQILQGLIIEPFSRKDYMKYYKISTATASLDLKKAVEKGVLITEGDKRNARYWYKNNISIIDID